MSKENQCELDDVQDKELYRVTLRKVGENKISVELEESCPIRLAFIFEGDIQGITHTDEEKVNKEISSA